MIGSSEHHHRTKFTGWQETRNRVAAGDPPIRPTESEPQIRAGDAALFFHRTQFAPEHCPTRYLQSRLDPHQRLSAEIGVRHKGVWLTTDPNPLVYTPRSGASKDQQIAYSHGTQSQAIRFEVLDADLYRRVDGILRRDRHTRWLYLDTVRKYQLSEPSDIEARKPLSGWPEAFGAGPETADATFDVMDLDDPGWTRLQGADRQPYDPRTALRALERGEATKAAWDELWSRLYRQGQVAEASYAAVPHLVRILAARDVGSWNTYALIAAIEQARQDGRNPDLPEYLRGAYQAAWRRLVELGLVELGRAEHPRLVSSITAAVAIGKGHRNIGRFAMLSEREQEKIFSAADQG